MTTPRILRPQSLPRTTAVLLAVMLLGTAHGLLCPEPASGAVLRLRGMVAKSAVSGATARLFALRANGTKGALLAARTTNASGIFSTVIDPAPTSPLLVQSNGGSYVDEVSGSVVAIPGASALTSILVPGRKWITVSPLTHMASSRARSLAAAGVPLAAAVTSSFTNVAQQYNLGDIRAIAPVNVADAEAVRLATVERRNYGLVLAGFSQLAADLGVSAVDLAAALARDASDGLLDGLAVGAAIEVPTGTVPIILPATAGTAGMQTAIDAFIASARNLSGITTMAIVATPQPIGSAVAGSPAITTTTLPAWVSGEFGSAAIAASGGTPPYTCAVSAGSLPAWLSLSEGCGLSGTAPLLEGGTTMSVSAPFTITLTDSAAATLPGSMIALAGPATDIRQFTVAIFADIPVAVPIQANCFKGVRCDEPVVTAVGGQLPYSFSRGSLAEGMHPLGTIVDLNGHLVGTPSVLGTYSFSACAVDAIGWMDCVTTSAIVSPAPTYLLRVSRLGNGNGTVTSTPPGISCGADCLQKYILDRKVTLKAVPAVGSLFSGWSGACTGTGPCVVTMGGPRNVQATFSRKSGSVTISTASCNFLRKEFVGGRWASYFEVLASGYAVGGVGADFVVASNPIFGSERTKSCTAWTEPADYSSTCTRMGAENLSTRWTARWAELTDDFNFDLFEGKVYIDAYVFQSGVPTVHSSAVLQCTVPP